MPLADLITLVDTAVTEEKDVDAKVSQLNSAKDALAGAQATVAEKQIAVDNLLTELSTEKSELVTAVRNIIDKCNEVLESLG